MLNPAAVLIEDGFSIFVVVCLMFLLMTLVGAGLYIYNRIANRVDSTVKSMRLEHKEERREWSTENRRSMDNVQLVLTELTTVIKTANEQATIQINNNGATGTQAQKGDNHG